MKDQRCPGRHDGRPAADGDDRIGVALAEGRGGVADRRQRAVRPDLGKSAGKSVAQGDLDAAERADLANHRVAGDDHDALDVRAVELVC
jgi:hypothetical protein